MNQPKDYEELPNVEKRNVLHDKGSIILLIIFMCIAGYSWYTRNQEDIVEVVCTM